MAEQQATAEPEGPWTIVAEPVGENPGLFDKAKAMVGQGSVTENTGGIVVYLKNGSQRQEVCRVAFIRRISKNPNTGFEEQLNSELEKARASARVLNEMVNSAGEVR